MLALAKLSSNPFVSLTMTKVVKIFLNQPLDSCAYAKKVEKAY